MAWLIMSEDEDVWANGEELSLTKQWIGQTEFISLPLSPTSENPSAEEAVNHPTLRRVRRGVTPRAASEGDAACQGEIALLGSGGVQSGSSGGLHGKERSSESSPSGGPSGPPDLGTKFLEEPSGPGGSPSDPWCPSLPLRPRPERPAADRRVRSTRVLA